MEAFLMADREFVLYRGRKFWLQTSGQYFQDGRKNSPERLLHRRVWTDHFGAIPDGFEVHHKDGNWRNDDPANYELRAAGAHQREHMRLRLEKPGELDKAVECLARGRVKAAKWHGSPE